MFPLLQLPDDILRVVIENFEYERRFLCQLARVCRRFSELTRPFIFRHIENPPGLTRRIRLQELLEENPNLKAYVHSIDTLTIGNSGVLRSRANEYKGYPNLRVLKVEKGTRPKLAHEDWRDRRKARTGENEFQCQFLEKYEFGNVREVYLQRPRNKMAADFTGTELLRFILLPNVRHLEAKSLMEIREPQLPPSLQEVKSRLTSLVLAGSQYWSMTPTALRTILTHCPELRILRIPYPLVHSTAEKPETISPSLLRWALEPVKDTLRELAILHAYGKVKYDDSYLDLSMFSVLKSINMISYCVIHPLEIGNDKNDIYKLLPPKLKELHIVFPKRKSPGIFYSTMESPIFVKLIYTGGDSIPKSRYEWIAQFVRHKDEAFPDLEKITLAEEERDLVWVNVEDNEEDREDEDKDLSFTWSVKEWEPPSEISSEFSERRVSLEVFCNFPKMEPLSSD